MKNLNQTKNFFVFSKNIVKKLPDSSGVYLFRDKDKEIIYIGKSKNLRNRILSYFNLSKSDNKKNTMIKKICYLNFLPTNSEFEAIILEANLVKKYKPIFNVQLKDDKSYLYLVITDEEIPLIKTARKTQLKDISGTYYGPFTKSKELYAILKSVRKIIPYSTHKPSKRICIYKQIGLCNPCPSEISNTKDKEKRQLLVKRYLKNIKHVKDIFEGKISMYKSLLYKEMLMYSKDKKFEKAAEIRERLKYYDLITTRQSSLDSTGNDYEFLIEGKERINELKDFNLILKKLSGGKINANIRRIECYDVSHLQGSFPTGSMVTFIDGKPAKKLYRHFKIETPSKNDIQNLEEIAKRRKKYLEKWGRPDLIIVDGGKAQVRVFQKIYEESKIPVVGIAKRLEEIIVPSEDNKFTASILEGPSKNLVQRIRDEAHRFAQRYHHYLVLKNLLGNAKI